MLLTAHPSRGLRGDIAVPGDKSISHRALIIGAMAQGETRIGGLLESDDVMRTVEAVRALGAEVERDGGQWLVRGGSWRSPTEPIDCGNSGTTARLLMGAVAGRPVSATFVGDASLSRRPMRRVTEPLRQMGARIEGGETLPITVHGRPLGPIDYAMPEASAQVKSAILLAGLGSSGRVRLCAPAVTRDHTERMLTYFGAPVGHGWLEDATDIHLGDERTLHGRDVHVPGDISSAAFLVVATLVVPGSEVTLRGVGYNPTRIAVIETLQAMGANIEVTSVRSRLHEGCEGDADLVVRTSRLHSVVIPEHRAASLIDEFPVLAIAAAFAKGETVLDGLGELRHKESDRLAAIANGLGRCGVPVRVDHDTLRIRGGSVPGGAEVATEGDHRIAMAFLALGLASAAPVSVDRAEMIATSFPGFADLMRGLGARIEPA